MKYYIDESGSTGDLLMEEDNLDFSEQEYFTLACIGLDDNILVELEYFISKLKKKYKIQSKELKFGKIKHIFGKKIGFILELLKYIEEDSKVLIEIVDKRYIIATNIVHCLINPPYFQREKSVEEEKTIHLVLAQWVYTYIPNEFFISFSNIARNPSSDGLDKLFKDLLKIAETINDESSNIVLGNIKESLDDYEIIKKRVNNTREAYTYFLPLPDLNKRGELIGILPHIGSFTNLHARLNFLYEDDLSSITIVHDNHAHFDKIIKSYHQGAVDNFDEKKIYEMANFRFKTISKLEFHNDKNKIGLQVADIFAGLINKSIAYLLKEEKYLKEKEYMILLQILTSLYYQKAINFVIPVNHREILFPILDKHLAYIMDMTYKGIDKNKIDNELLEKN